MKRFLLIIMGLMTLVLLNAIECVMADGQQIHLDSREYHFRYHNSTNDYYFFGSNKWAVRFNFRNAYPGISAANFEIRGARLWFPNPGDSVRIELLTDLDGQPGELLRFSEAAVTQSLMDIHFPESYTSEKIWLMVSYSTDIGQRWVSASHSGGNNSYFMNQVGDVQVLSSFASAGFNCELLFGLLGDFQLSEPDLQLSTFKLEGDLLPGTRVSPAFSIYNHSAQSVSSANLELVLSKPGAPAYETHNIAIEEDIPPFTLVEYGSETAWLPQIDLPEEPTQLRVVATLSSEFAENDTLEANNQLSKSYNVFADELPVLLLENFLRVDETGVITTLQDPFMEDRHQLINYYPILSDSLSNLASQRRFNWYQFNSVPRTVGMGDTRITGFRADYSPLFQELCASLEDRRTFISSSSCTSSSQEGTENILVTIQLENQNTNLYTAAGQSIMSGSRFFVALAQKHLIESSERFVLNRFVSFADTINVALNAGSSLTKSYNFTISGITSGELVDNYRLFYWLQANAGGAVYYANYSDFRPETFVSNSDPLQQAPGLKLWPNPLRSGHDFFIQSKSPANGRLSIYNIRGQLIFRDNEFKGALKLKSTDFPSSGIYLVHYTDAGGQESTQKISMIK